MYNLGFVFAMPEEAEAFLKSKSFTIIEKAPYKIYRRNETIVIISGIGTVNSAGATSYLLSKYKVENIINVGLAGTDDTALNMLDIVVIGKSYYGAVDATGFGYKYGQVPQEKPFYESDSKLMEKIGYLLSSTCPIRNLGTTDMFLNSQQLLDNFIKKVDDKVNLFDMEGTAVYQIADKHNKPCISLKIISDFIGKDITNEEQFDVILEKGGEKISKILNDIVNQF